MKFATLFAHLLLLSATPALAAQAPAPAAGARAEAKPADVASMDAILAAVYASISGDKGVERDWDRFRSLFHPSARLTAIGRPAGAPQARARVMTPDDYIAANEGFLEGEGFHERELARRVESFGPIAHVFSTYEARRSLADPKPFMRGINSIQLFNDGTRWWVMSIVWSPESPANPLPDHYLATPRTAR